MTTQQQKTIDELKVIFERINALETPSSDLMEQIASELNRATALKLKSEAALKAERSKAHEMMTRHVSSVYRPILSRFIPEIAFSINDDGSFFISHSYHTFRIKSIIYEHKNEDKSKFYEHEGFQVDKSHSKSEITISLSNFNEDFKKFVIDAKKSIDSNYY